MVRNNVYSSYDFLEEYSIYLCSNEIGVAGAEALASYLIQIPEKSVEILRLSFNRIADEGMKGFADALCVNKSLCQLTLKHNKAKQSGLISLGEALYNNNTIQLLTLIGMYAFNIYINIRYPRYTT